MCGFFVHLSSLCGGSLVADGGRLLAWDSKGRGEAYPARGWGSRGLTEVPVPSLGSGPDPVTSRGTSGSTS